HLAPRRHLRGAHVSASPLLQEQDYTNSRMVFPLDVREATATTACGAVRGSVVDGVARFLGIPFAEPPVGPRRFRPAGPPPGWEGERDCTAYGPICPQFQMPPDLFLMP